MQRTVQNVKNSLKFKATEKNGVVSVRVGTKKYTVPVTARMLSNSDYLFLSFPATSELYRFDDGKLAPLQPGEDATPAYAALNPSKKRKRKKAASQLPAQVAEALKAIPSGYRLGYDADGAPKLVKTRTRRSK